MIMMMMLISVSISINRDLIVMFMRKSKAFAQRTSANGDSSRCWPIGALQMLTLLGFRPSEPKNYENIKFKGLRPRPGGAKYAEILLLRGLEV